MMHPAFPMPDIDPDDPRFPGFVLYALTNLYANLYRADHQIGEIAARQRQGPLENGPSPAQRAQHSSSVVEHLWAEYCADYEDDEPTVQ